MPSQIWGTVVSALYKKVTPKRKKYTLLHAFFNLKIMHCCCFCYLKNKINYYLFFLFFFFFFFYSATSFWHMIIYRHFSQLQDEDAILFPVWTQGSAMLLLVHSVPMSVKSRKWLAHDIFDTLPHAWHSVALFMMSLIAIVTQSAAHKMAVYIYFHWFLSQTRINAWGG